MAVTDNWTDSMLYITSSLGCFAYFSWCSLIPSVCHAHVVQKYSRYEAKVVCH